MKIAGVIAEYNPFHAGHAYHLAQTRARTGCDYVVVCMAGSLYQRGEAACLSKWARAEMALRCGADAVFELPALFAVRPADAFAHGRRGRAGRTGRRRAQLRQRGCRPAAAHRRAERRVRRAAELSAEQRARKPRGRACPMRAPGAPPRRKALGVEPEPARTRPTRSSARNTCARWKRSARAWRLLSSRAAAHTTTQRCPQAAAPPREGLLRNPPP